MFDINRENFASQGQFTRHIQYPGNRQAGRLAQPVILRVKGDVRQFVLYLIQDMIPP